MEIKEKPASVLKLLLFLLLLMVATSWVFLGVKRHAENEIQIRESERLNNRQ